jgi:hypothetical protein
MILSPNLCFKFHDNGKRTTSLHSNSAFSFLLFVSFRFWPCFLATTKAAACMAARRGEGSDGLFCSLVRVAFNGVGFGCVGFDFVLSLAVLGGVVLSLAFLGDFVVSVVVGTGFGTTASAVCG